MRSWSRSIEAKIFAVVFATTCAVVAFLTTYLASREVEGLRHGMEVKATAYAALLAKEVDSAVAFDDRETAREEFEAAMSDGDVQALALYRADGTLLHLAGELEGPIAAGEAGRLETGPGWVRATAHVASREGPTGMLVVELTTGRIVSERRQVVRVALGVGAVGVGLAFIASLAIGRSVARRLRRIAAATRAVASGDLDQPPIVDRSDDEIGQLASAFDVMCRSIRSLLEQIATSNEKERERLEATVSARTAEIEERSRQQRLVLDHVEQGLFTVNRAGTITGEHSRALADWFGAPPPGATLWGWFAPIHASAAAWMCLAWEMLADDDLPVEVALAGLPQRVEFGARIYSLAYRPIFAGAAISEVLVVVSDVTAQAERAKADEAQRELVALVDHVTRDRAAVVELVDEWAKLVGRITSEDLPATELMRAAHTLRGNASLFGLGRLADACAAIEATISDTGAPPSPEERDLVVACWEAAQARAARLLGEGDSRLDVSEDDWQALVDATSRGAPRSELLALLRSWRHEPVARRLARVAEHTRALAQRLGKTHVRVTSEVDATRLDAARFAPFWSSFVHVVRNALDHGIEDSNERLEGGKPTDASLCVRARTRDDGDFVVEIADDGRGIDRARLAERGHSLEAPVSTWDDLVALLFRDGVSTKDVVSSISGRGVGLAAVRSECEKLGGHVEVDSDPGRGSCFRFVFPRVTSVACEAA